MSETTQDQDKPQGADGATRAAGAAGAAGTGDDGGSLFDLPADSTPKQGADGRPVRPDFLPEQFWDAEGGKPLLESMAKSWQDMRSKVARGEHKPPETPEGYALPKIEGIPETVGGKDDPLWGAVRTAAHEAGVTQQQLEKLATPYLQHLAETMKTQGIKPAQTPEQQQAALQAERRAELAKLGPDGAAVVRDVGTWLRGLETRGLLSAQEHQALRMVGTADGVRAMAKLRELAGERPIPVTALDDGTATEADARRTLTEGYAKSDEAMIERGRAMLTRLEKAGRLGRK